ncbi:MAG: PQQ-binding-like beta-propeller repeat protein [Rubripirellula sp.]
MRLQASVFSIGFWIGISAVSPGVAWSQTDTPDGVAVHDKTVVAEIGGADWPRFLGSNYDGSISRASPGIDWMSPPEFDWAIEVGDGYGIGTVAEGRYFQFDANSDVGGANERLRCFDFESGEELWSRTNAFQYQDMLGYEDGPRSSPAVVEDRVLTLGVTGLLTCRRSEDGQEIWSVDTSTKYGVVQNFFGVGASPMVLDERVIVMVGGSPPEDQEIAPGRLDRVTDNGSAVVAFDLKSGRQLWKCGNDLASYSSPRPIEINGKTFVLVFARTGLMLIDPAIGKVKWQFKHRAEVVESVNAIVPVVSEDQVFISECYGVGSVLLAVTEDAAKVIWQDPDRDRRNQAMRCHWATPVLVDGYLYGCSGRNAPDSDFRCVDWQTGEVQWTDPRRTRSSVTRVGNHLVVIEERGTLQILKVDPEKMDVVAEWDLQFAKADRPVIEYPCWAAPVMVGTKLMVRGTDRVLCLDMARR